MEITILYILLFCIGTVFGSFFTLAVYRIPLGEDITHKRSFCPNCKHKLSFWDMIPILSYLCLGGKCRYCKEKIRPRYCILEIITGVLFVLYAMSLHITPEKIVQLDTIMYLIAGLLFIAGLILIAGIDLEKRQISKGVLLYETLISASYMSYMLFTSQMEMIRYVSYFFGILIIFLLLKVYQMRKKETSYLMEILLLGMIMASFGHSLVFYITVIVGLMAIAIDTILADVSKEKQRKRKIMPVQIGYYLSICNIITIIILNYMIFLK